MTTTITAPPSTEAPAPSSLIDVLGVKLPVRDLPTSRAWYERVFGLRLLREFPDDDGVVRGVAYVGPGGVGLSLREHPALAGLHGFDPVAFAAGDAAGVAAWSSHLTRIGVPHQVADTPVGPIAIFADPDGLELHVYARDGLGLPDGLDGTPDETEVQQLVADAETAAAAWMRGDLDLYLSLTAHAAGMTLAPPFGGPATAHADWDAELRGWESTFADGDARLEQVTVHTWADTAIMVGVERTHGRVGALPHQDWPLRVTQVLRRVGGRWLLVHRHADPLVETLEPTAAAALARGNRPT